jgi:hypothetical protein
MVNSCCTLLDAASLLQNEFVTKVYTDPECDTYNCARCDEPASEVLGKAILTTLRDQATILQFVNLIQLRAAFWSLLGRSHGTNHLTSFYIVDVAESTSGILATVRTEHGQQRRLDISEEDFLEMVGDPFLDQENDVNRVWRKLTAPNIGRAPRLHPAPVTLKEIPCWCCDRKIRFWGVEP